MSKGSSTTNNKPKRKKKCKNCLGVFLPERSLQIACGYICAMEYGAKQRKKKERKETKEKLNALKSVTALLGETQDQAFNPFIRERDREEPCISCNRHHRGQYHAGHYKSVGAHPELRFEEDNVHKQCKPCNKDLSGNILEYRKGLIKKIGIDRVDWLEGPHDAKKYTKDDAREIKTLYKRKVKEL